MRRGVLKLSTEELEIAIGLIESSNYATKTLFLQKLSLARENPEAEKHVDVNEQDVEVLLDTLGIPTQAEPKGKVDLRIKLQNLFLNVLG